MSDQRFSGRWAYIDNCCSQDVGLEQLKLLGLCHDPPHIYIYIYACWDYVKEEGF